jgi:ribosomal protein S18 acetylase RimI-like enzyme
LHHILKSSAPVNDIRMKPLPEGISVVPIRVEHIDSFWEAVGSVARERRWLMGVDAYPKDATEAFVRTNIEARNPQFVALRDGRVVGWCDIVPLAAFPGFEHNGRLGMGVLAGWRGCGIGGALIDAAMAAAPAAGFTRIELEAYASNTAALALYERRGFVIEGTKRGVRILDGRTEDLVCMALRLEEVRG